MANNPILNSPYKEPLKHFKSNEKGLTEEVLEFRRPSSFYIPVPRAKTKEKQLDLNITEGAYGSELEKENELINKIRVKIKTWREAGYQGITKTSRDLLFYWNDENRENKLFFCQIEALETLMYINEVAEKSGENWIINTLKKAGSDANPGLYRLAFKMATGSGKTVVMAMIIAYHTLNKIRYPQDTRFTDAFVIITPGITIRDRLNVLRPNDPHNYYRQPNIVSIQDLELLQQAVVFITNFHQLELRQNPRFQLGAVIKASGIIKDEAMKETPNAMVNRAFKSILNKQRVLVINDEAHHCYREKPSEEKLAGEDRKEAEENNKSARVWISGIEALYKKIAVNGIIDLSATPYFLRGSGYQEGTLFPWTIYDFSLLDALECENEPTEVTSSGIIGVEIKETMERIKERREGEVIMHLTSALLKRYYTDADGAEKYWLGPQLRRIAEQYVKNYVVLKDRMVIGFLSVGQYFSGALTKIQQAIIVENIKNQKDKKLLPILVPYDTIGSTRYIDFLTTKEVRETTKSHINYVVADTEEWEQGVAKRLEQMPEVLTYVKNQNLGFTIPYEHQGIGRQYTPDFIVKIEKPDKSILNLIIEVTGQKDDKKTIKVKTAREMWIPAVNNMEKFGKWAIIEVQDIHETQNLIRAFINNIASH